MLRILTLVAASAFVVTARTDAQAYFTAKLGPHVRTEVIADRVECYLASSDFNR